VNFDVQGDLLTHGRSTRLRLDRAAARQLELQLFGREHQARGVLRLLKGYTGRLRVNLDQTMTPRLDLSVGGFFAKSTTIRW